MDSSIYRRLAENIGEAFDSPEERMTFVPDPTKLGRNMDIQFGAIDTHGYAQPEANIEVMYYLGGAGLCIVSVDGSRVYWEDQSKA